MWRKGKLISFIIIFLKGRDAHNNQFLQNLKKQGEDITEVKRMLNEYAPPPVPVN